MTQKDTHTKKGRALRKGYVRTLQQEERLLAGLLNPSALRQAATLLKAQPVLKEEAREDAGEVSIGGVALLLFFLLLFPEKESEDRQVERDPNPPAEDEIDVADLAEWGWGILAAILACPKLVTWISKLINLVARVQLTPEGPGRQTLEAELQAHLQSFFTDVAKLSKKTERDVPDPYHSGDFDRRDSFTISVCGEKDFTICIWQDEGALLPEIMVTVIGPDGKEKVIFWTD